MEQLLLIILNLCLYDVCFSILTKPNTYQIQGSNQVSEALKTISLRTTWKFSHPSRNCELQRLSLQNHKVIRCQIEYSQNVVQKCGFYTSVQDQRNSKFECSYWWRAKLWTLVIYTRVQVQGMEKQIVADVAPLSPHSKNTSPGLMNQVVKLGSNLELKSEICLKSVSYFKFLGPNSLCKPNLSDPTCTPNCGD